jgi:hypothetical protein
VLELQSHQVFTTFLLGQGQGVYPRKAEMSLSVPVQVVLKPWEVATLQSVMALMFLLQPVVVNLLLAMALGLSAG